MKMMQDEDRISLLCALLALKDAGYNVEQQDKLYTIKNLPHASILIGTGFSGLQTSFNSYCSHNCEEKAHGHFDRMIIPRMMPNSVAAWISIFFNIKGGALTVNASCASGTIAVGRASRSIKNGYCTSVIAGGVECMKESTGAIMRGFDVIGALTTSDDGYPIPFSKKRSGFLFSEGGGCILVLEELEQALKRGAGIYAEIVDYSENSDAYGIIRTLINATKGILGHTIGASGAI
ncbi:MAG: hypothetical protein JXJ04_03555 [Spirochaetales bacterium]|nr:hypothetical protein [Spirochaetales bacterium]